MTDYKKVRYYLRDFHIDYGHLTYALYPYAHMNDADDIVRDLKSTFLVNAEMQITPSRGCRIECKFESPSKFLDFNRHIHVEYDSRVFSDFEKPRKYIEFQVPKITECKEFIVESVDYTIDHLTHAGEIVIGVSGNRINIDELVSCILHFYPIAQFSYQMTCSEPMTMRVELGEAGVLNFINRITSIGTEEGNKVRIRFDDEYGRPISYMLQKYYARDIAATKQLMNDRYGIANAKIKDYFPGYTYTPRRESQPKYFAVSSEGYKPIERIKEVDEWLDIDDMWKHYMDSFQTGVAIVKEEDNMAGYKLKDISPKQIKLYMLLDKPMSNGTRGTATNIKDLPDVIRNVQFNEKKGVVTVIWVDGTVTMAKCGPNDIWDPEKGLSIAIMKRFFKSTTSMNKWIKKTVPEETEETDEEMQDRLTSLIRAYNERHTGSKKEIEPAKSDDPKESFF